MSDPVRITNPGAESLGYDSDGHEIMAVDIYVNPPRVDVFHGTPPAWSSFGNKTIWGGNEWVDDSPTRSDIEKRDKEITAYKMTLSAQQKENENKRTEAAKRLSAAIAAREKDENTPCRKRRCRGYYTTGVQTPAGRAERIRIPY